MPNSSCCAAPVRCVVGEILFRKGEIGQNMYVIESGRVRLDFGDGLPSKLLGSREYFGELALFISNHARVAGAVAHRFSRLRDVDTVEAQRRFGEETDQTFLERLGSSPAPVCERLEPSRRQKLQAAGDSPLDKLLARRVTCRNYDTARQLDLATFGAAMYRAFGARAVDEYAPGIFLLKKGAPSAGGLHPVEAYVLVQRVDGIASGLYHYHPVAHALEPIREMDTAELETLAKSCLGGQPYLAQAHVVAALAGRFARNFWKYRNHAKAYRAVILDAGHLSQTLYLTTTELGL